ncbi:DUF3265 domain-containing protein [Vibrio parahaemolyticus]|nr:DUF3265 domain-containing protein [Vibrio parahaemolyticus]MBO0180089.1 DUF3265 domain-containing protein [Vibrio parahaemolyticus]MCI9702126.1 DUF3265 domain-containing protein [Vibrio parahaemolyticus]HBC3568754.1 DUF3265 domain-containing protein [Vibrio parahaemolyticus]HCH0799197.1 DUF3265 domain-containing protein [Vibrio parahaemolyticus]
MWFRVICFQNHLNIGGKLRLTSNLRGIHNAWHFYYALVFVFKVVCCNFGIALFTP